MSGYPRDQALDYCQPPVAEKMTVIIGSYTGGRFPFYPLTY